MTTDTASDTPTAQVSFVRWLYAQVKGDTERQMPYAAIYRWGRNIQSILGTDGRFDAEWVALELSQQGADADALAALASAEAAWRVDTMIDHAEKSGVVLPVRETGEEIVPSSVSEAVEAAHAKVLCGYRNHRGEGCTNEAVSGAGRCERHGGAITDPEVRRSFLIVAYAKIIDGTRVAVDALLDVAENGRSEMARVQAAKEILDRAGVQQDQHVHIHRPDEDASEDELVEALRKRLFTASDRLRIQAIPVASEDTTASQLGLPVASPSFDIESYPQQPEPDPTITEVSESDDIVDAEIVSDV